MANRLRDGLPHMPRRMRERLQIDDRGYPIPWFTPYDEFGKPIFTAVDPRSVHTAWKCHTCWICGDMLGIYHTFVVSPLCIISGVSSEPPSHFECALFAAKACPFLSNPKAHYQKAGVGNKPLGTTAPIGMLPNNPGICIIWTTRFPGLEVTEQGSLFLIGPPVHASFYKEARRATWDEVNNAFKIGLARLEDQAQTEGIRSMAALHKKSKVAHELMRTLFNTQMDESKEATE